MINEVHKAILNQATYGWVVLILPPYNSSAVTPLQHEENIKALRKPYEELIRQGYIVFGGRHVGRERYKLTAKAQNIS